jgi:hypothetical protein
MIASGTGLAGEDDDDPLLRPAWEETEDETDGDLGLRRPLTHPASLQDPSTTADAWRALLLPLCTATDLLARLDARAEAATTGVREGLIARLAYLEASGFLAHAHAWAHQLDLALRERGLTASAALAAAGVPDRALPQTFASTGDPRTWMDPAFDELAASDAALAAALALARALHGLAGKGGGAAFSHASAAAATLRTLGASQLDPVAFTAWWDAATPKPVVHQRRFGRRREEEIALPLPPLLAAAQAAQSWMEAGLTDAPMPAQALLLSATILARSGILRVVCLPVWTAYPAVGFGDRATLPTLRSDAADRLIGGGVPITWPFAFLHLVAESARMGLRELDRLDAVAEKGRALAARADKRSRLPDAVDALLHTPVLTPMALAACLKVAPQTATAVLRTLQDEGVVREVTRRGRFRAFAM